MKSDQKRLFLRTRIILLYCYFCMFIILETKLQLWWWWFFLLHLPTKTQQSLCMCCVLWLQQSYSTGGKHSFLNFNILPFLIHPQIYNFIFTENFNIIWYLQSNYYEHVHRKWWVKTAECVMCVLQLCHNVIIYLYVLSDTVSLSHLLVCSWNDSWAQTMFQSSKYEQIVISNETIQFLSFRWYQHLLPLHKITVGSRNQSTLESHAKCSGFFHSAWCGARAEC